jgi:glutathione S-transferase
MNESHAAFIVGRATERADQYWGMLDRRLAEHGPWLMGDVFSALDIYAFMLSLWGRPSEAALHAKFSRVAGLAMAVRARPKLKATLEAHGVMELGGYGG